MSQQKSECAYSSCRNEPLKSSKDGYCIYHAKAGDKSGREFKEALKKHIDERNYDFSDFVFVGNINFKEDFGVTIFEEADFGEASFQGKTTFGGALFQGRTIFWGASFQEEVDFVRASFQGEANFLRASFQGEARFGKTSFQGHTSFAEASFQVRTIFWKTSFQGDTTFAKASFQERVHFIGASFREWVSFAAVSFQGEANFVGTSFQGKTTFAKASFQGEANFEETEFLGITSISPECMEGNVSFVNTILDNSSLTPLNLDKNAWIGFKGARLKNTQIRREDIENHIEQEQEKDFSGAKEIYLLLKNNFHTLGRYDEESWAFKKEKDMERKSYFYGRSLKWLGSMFWNLLYGYGEEPFWIFGWCGFLLLFSSLIYWLSKEVFHVVGTCLIPVEGYWNNLYFSVVTFTTLGYGDFRPVGTVKVLASVEALLGIFLIALFIFAFARRTGGR